MAELQIKLTTAPVLLPINFMSGWLLILVVNASLKGWGSCLMQEDLKTKKRHPARYDSGI